MHVELEDPPACLRCTHITGLQMLCHLIACSNLACCPVRPLEAVLVEVLDRAKATTDLTVDVATISCREVGVVRNNISVGVGEAIWSLAMGPSIVSTTVDRIRVVSNHGVLLEVARIALGAVSILHAGGIGVCSTAGAMEHAVGDDLGEFWLEDGVGEFCTDELVDLVYSGKLVFWSKEDEEVHVRKAPLLELDDVDVSDDATKDAIDHDLLEECLLLHLEDTGDDVWTIGWDLAFEEGLEDLRPVGVAGHGEEDVRPGEESDQGH